MFGFSFDKTMEEVKQELDAGKDIQLIDVRELDEYQEGHIPGADHLALSELEEKAAAVVAAGKPHYLYCRSGQRSRTALKRLKALGYSELYNIGGILLWPYAQKAGNQK